MNIYVGNLAYGTGEEDLRQAFAAFGEVSSVSIIKDKFTGNSRGFAFVEMPNNREGQAAIEGMNGKELNGRTLTVNEARPRTEGGPRGGGGAGRGGGGGFGSGRREGNRRGGNDRGSGEHRRGW